MRSLDSISLILLAVIFGVLSAAPIPPSRQKPRLYFPTQVGAKWVYQDGAAEWTQMVTEVEEKDGSKIVTVCEMSRVDGSKKMSDHIEVSEQGLFVLVENGTKLRRQTCLIKLPKKGSKLQLDGSVVTTSEDETMKLFGPDRIEVPAGTFWAVRVEGVSAPIDLKKAPANPLVPALNPAFMVKAVRWYAPEVGLIKEKVWKGDTIHRLVELKSFTPGRD